MQQQFVFPVILKPEADGGYVVNFPDVPEAITQGDTVEHALSEAADCLDEAVAGRVDDNEPIPEPSPLKRGQYLVAVPARTAAKAALYLALREADISKSELARRLELDEKEVRRMLDPRYATKIDRIEAAFGAGQAARRWGQSRVGPGARGRNNKATPKAPLRQGLSF